MLALAMIPILGAISAAVDYSRASLERNAMQAALDSTALMLAREVHSLSPAEVEAKATAYFNSIFTGNQAKGIVVTSSVTNPLPGTFALKVASEANVPTSFTKVLGKNEINISASAEAVWGIKKLNLALALDNTGSMGSSGKMDALKAAAHDLLATVQKAAQKPGDVKVSIIPFATDVNIGTDNVNASWIHWAEWEAVNGACSNTYYKNQSSCTSNGNTWTPASHSTWNGCVYDRDQNNDVLNAATVTGVAATMFRAHQASSCPASMLPLTSDWAALNAKVDTMAPAGNTNVTIGLELAWQTLTATEPFNAPPKDPELEKVIVVLTDGTNTQNRWTSSTSSIDARTQKACDNAKADGVKIYTVRVVNGNASLLQDCASKPSMYYDVQDASQLLSAFGSIAQNLAKLRLSK